MNNKEKFNLLKTVQNNNILPITSNCNLKCKFCSHFQNPPGLEVYRFGNIKLETVEEMIGYLPEDGPVILGESATKIIEGEPFFHPDITKILRMIRNMCPEKEIKITTNGSLLTEDIIKLLTDIENIYLNISINCANPHERKYLMNDKDGEIIFSALKMINNYDIDYTGSLVALPHIMGWESIEKTIEILSTNKAKTIRVFMPGFTDYAYDDLMFDKKMYTKLKLFIKKMKSKFSVPIVLEPPFLLNFTASVEGVICNSIADHKNIEIGDIVKEVDNKTVISRVEAFRKIKAKKDPLLKIYKKKEDKHIETIFEKEKNEQSGLIFHYDLPRDTVEKVKRIIKKYLPDEVIIVTSVIANRLIKFMVNEYIKSDLPTIDIRVQVVENEFFGGNIVTAGLLTVNDIINNLSNYKQKKDKNRLILLPGIIFDNYGNDLIGNNFSVLEEIFGAYVEVI